MELIRNIEEKKKKGRSESKGLFANENKGAKFFLNTREQREVAFRENSNYTNW